MKSLYRLLDQIMSDRAKWLEKEMSRLVEDGIMPSDIYRKAYENDPQSKLEVKKWFKSNGLEVVWFSEPGKYGGVLKHFGKIRSTLDQKIKVTP